MDLIKELSQIQRAQDIAMDVHSKQKRNVTKSPYYIHPYRVYQRAKSMGYNKDIQLISLLHDVYEDSKNKKYVEDIILSRFNDKILKFIKILSHDKSIDYNTYVLDIAKKSNIALTVKLLDMYENLSDNPNEHQVYKYLTAIKYLIDNNIQIDKKLISLFKKFKLK